MTTSDAAVAMGADGWTAPAGPTTVVTQFARQVLATPGRSAVVEGDESLTYGELAVRVHRLATDLDHVGVQRGHVVAVAVPSGIDQAIGVLAVLSLGAAFMAIDLDEPLDRLGRMLEEADVRVALARPGAIDFAQIAVLSIDPAGTAEDPPFDLPPGRIGGLTRSADLACICATAGTSGLGRRPVMIEHGQLFAMLQGMDAVVDAHAAVVWLATSGLSQTQSIVELLWTLTHGHQVVYAGQLHDGASVVDAVRRHQVTTMQLAPSRLARLLVDVDSRAALASLRQLLVGGEVLSPVLAAEALSLGPSVWHLYGATESSGWATAHRVGVEDLAGPVPIGRPLAHVRVDVVDDDGRAVGVGQRGHLLLAGESVARGYLSRPKLTGECFRAAVSLTGQIERWYTTGDDVEVRPGGELAFLGRASDCIMVNGRLVTLQAIEAALASHPAVRRVRVENRTIGRGAAAVRATVVVRADARASVDELRLYATQRLRVQIVLMDIIVEPDVMRPAPTDPHLQQLQPH